MFRRCIVLSAQTSRTQIKRVCPQTLRMLSTKVDQKSLPAEDTQPFTAILDKIKTSYSADSSLSPNIEEPAIDLIAKVPVIEVDSAGFASTPLPAAKAAAS
jgi:hypothetical protein